MTTRQLVLDIADEDVLDGAGRFPAINFATLHANGFRVAIFRRSNCYYDSTHRAWRLASDKSFATYAAAARAAGLVVGAYMFPSFAAGAPSAAEQVANFFASGGELDALSFPGIVDVEFPGNGLKGTGRTPAQVAAFLVDLVTEMKKQGGRTPGIYTSHVQVSDDDQLDGALSRLPADVQAELADGLLWQKLPYREGAHQPLDEKGLEMVSHDGPLASDRFDYWRTPAPWEGVSGAMLVQTQGDVRDVRLSTGGIHQADVGYARVSAVGDRGNHVKWIRRRLVALRVALGETGSATHALTAVSDSSNSTSESDDSPIFDSALAAAVKAFQQARGLVADGVVGAATTAALA